MFFPPGSSNAEKYEGERELGSFVQFLNTKAGTQRDPDGNLLPEAGRISTLDDHIAASDNYDTPFLNKLQEIIGSLDGSAKEQGKLYIAIANKILEKGVDYVKSEIDRLEKMIKNASVSSNIQSNIQLM